VVNHFITNLQRRSGVWWKSHLLRVSWKGSGHFCNWVFLIPFPSHGIESFLALHPRHPLLCHLDFYKSEFELKALLYMCKCARALRATCN
jgi:hypothetical protein